MNENELQVKLIAVARKNEPSDKTPYAFEKRIMSRLEGAATPTIWAVWTAPLWRAALSCMVVTVLCGMWAYHAHQATEVENLSQDFEAAVFAPINQQLEDSW